MLLVLQGHKIIVFKSAAFMECEFEAFDQN